MTGIAGHEHLCVACVIERRRLLRGNSMRMQSHSRYEERHDVASAPDHGTPLTGRAGGNHWSALERSVTDARALTRHWFQSMAAASGRSRDSQ